MQHLICAVLLFAALSCDTSPGKISIELPEQPPARMVFGVEKLKKELEDLGYEIIPASDNQEGPNILFSIIGDDHEKPFKERVEVSQADPDSLNKEGFQVISDNQTIWVRGKDASGALYGALAIGEHFQRNGEADFSLNYAEHPEMVLRGTAIGLQKTEYLPGRGVYEYPYTPENFPWFYDKELWLDYLDMLVENRMNTLYLWNGHPFASLVKLEEYPYALEVDEETFKKNEEIFSFLTEEADKRGIWVIQMFYNVIVSKPFADHHGIATQDRSRPLMPLLAEYTQKSIAAFIAKYPNVGLLVALGEAMQGEENDVKWFTETVIPGVKEGLDSLGITEEPPIILRAHDTNGPLVMEKSLPIYQNLYTMHKYNGESLTTYEPRGPWAKIHTDLSEAAPVHISNVHILANLEPFRFGSPDFIQKSVKAMHEVHQANALHLYPQASYWDWPYTADKTPERLLQLDRDWIWYKAWARYAWNKDRDRSSEMDYWTEQLAQMYGNKQAGENILKAYEETGEIAPKLLRRFGITEGNRQTLLLGMFGSQLVNPYKWRVYPGFYESCGPEGEILISYAEKEFKGEPHIGETPTQIIDEVVEHGSKAYEAIEAASGEVSRNIDEFERLKNDVYAYRHVADFFAEKVKAALWVLRFSHSEEVEDLEKALPHLRESVAHYRKLVEVTKDHYLYANSMQTAQRRIPIGGDDGKNKTWEEMLPHYEKELSNFERNLQLVLETKGARLSSIDREPWEPAEVEWIYLAGKETPLSAGVDLYGETSSPVQRLAGELEGLSAIKLDSETQRKEGTRLHFKSDKAVKLVTGYFSTDEKEYLSPPDLETDAAGNLQGQAEILLANAMELEGLPRVNIHTYHFEAGVHEWELDPGKILILGFVDGEEELQSRDVGIIGEEQREAVDWVFY
ncbi:alpha-d-galacturonidase [Pleomorphovibrio marinus]|uniref:alpha-d-galacturonidase n=1 Tax=Pleomorphovibrio marinus TaxID=2164132 RepID=UPI000E0AB348|nr:hypothetical protein [Pleomorphovibrio marinus]